LFDNPLLSLHHTVKPSTHLTTSEHTFGLPPSLIHDHPQPFDANFSDLFRTSSASSRLLVFRDHLLRNMAVEFRAVTAVHASATIAISSSHGFEQAPTPPLQFAADALSLSAGSPRSSATGSSPATSWSDGDRERMPTHALIGGAATLFANLAATGDEALNRRTKPDNAAALADVLVRLAEGGVLSGHVLVCALSLASRTAAAVPKSVSSITIRRITVACCLLAAKAEADEQVAINFYASVSGVTADTLRATEGQIFARLEFQLGTTASTFHATLAQIVMESPDAAIAELLG
jgi:hypothetical protein